MGTLENARMSSLRDKQLARAEKAVAEEVKEATPKIKTKGRGKKQKEK